MPGPFTSSLGLRLCALSTLMLVGGGCSTADPQQQAQAEFDRRIGWEGGAISEVCVQMPAAEVSQAVGEQVVESRSAEPGSGYCEWLALGRFSVRIHAPGALPERTGLLADMDHDYRAEALPGMGLEARVELLMGETHRATARTATARVEATAERREAAVALLQLALARLPATEG